jgi:hypothetical protein
MTDEQTQQESPEQAGYEKKDASVAWIATIALLIVAVIAAFAIGLNEYFLISKESLIYDQQLSTRNKVLRDLRATEEEALNSYKVLNADSGRYQIPIDRAMKLMADEAYQARLDKTKK